MCILCPQEGETQNMTRAAAGLGAIVSTTLSRTDNEKDALCRISINSNTNEKNKLEYLSHTITQNVQYENICVGNIMLNFQNATSTWNMPTLQC